MGSGTGAVVSMGIAGGGSRMINIVDIGSRKGNRRFSMRKLPTLIRSLSYWTNPIWNFTSLDWVESVVAFFLPSITHTLQLPIKLSGGIFMDYLSDGGF